MPNPHFPSNSYEDTCLYCGGHVGYGAPGFHIGVCDRPVCQEKYLGPRWQILLDNPDIETAEEKIIFQQHCERLRTRHQRHGIKGY